MLYHEVAIDPLALISSELQLCLKNDFGLNKGRFISAFPRDWANRVRQCANGIDDEDKKMRIRSLLHMENISHSIIDLDRGSFNNTWEEGVERQHKIKPFNAILSDGETAAPYYSAEETDTYIKESDEQVGYLDVSRKLGEDGAIRALHPFLLQNKCLVLVNAYQKLLTDQKSEHIFKKLFEYWVSHGGKEFRVIRSTRNLSRSDFNYEADRLDKFLLDKKYTGVFKYIAVDDEHDRRNRLHERYLIGNFSGVSMGYGLELNSKPQTWVILSKALHNKVHREYMDEDFISHFQEEECYDFFYRRRTHYVR